MHIKLFRDRHLLPVGVLFTNRLYRRDKAKSRSSHGRQNVIISIIFIAVLFLSPFTAYAKTNPSPAHASIDTTAPVINVWYGNRQTFGRQGSHQRWVNVLGNVSDIESDIALLTYTLNGGPGPVIDGTPGKLMLGPHPAEGGPRRLYFKGDFNIEIDKDNLKDGLNTIFITAENSAGLQSRETVIVDYHRGNIWPLPYHIDWTTVKNAQDILQITDGLWRWDKSGIRPVLPAYDRVIAVGDMTWSDYEVLVPITLHGIDTSAYSSPVSVGPAFGIILRWQGHSDTPKLKIPCIQPHCGWKPSGASPWYIYKQHEDDYIIIGIDSDRGHPVRDSSLQFEINKTYWFRARAETTAAGYYYCFKVWEAGTGEPPRLSLIHI